nr:MAG TPA: Cob(I)alamin adenosyltransferase [Caudoviricetes sp.]
MNNLLWIFALGSGENTAVIFGYNCDVDLLRAIMITWLIQSVVFGLIVSSLARKKRRSPTNYFWVGFFFGLIGLLYTIGVPAITPEQYREQMAKRQAEREARKGEIKFNRIVVAVCIAAFIALFMVAGAFR